jgi:hypothetical protein
MEVKMKNKTDSISENGQDYAKQLSFLARLAEAQNQKQIFDYLVEDFLEKLADAIATQCRCCCEKNKARGAAYSKTNCCVNTKLKKT